jgi:hypothetical protein
VDSYTGLAAHGSRALRYPLRGELPLERRIPPGGRERCPVGSRSHGSGARDVEFPCGRQQSEILPLGYGCVSDTLPVPSEPVLPRWSAAAPAVVLRQPPADRRFRRYAAAQEFHERRGDSGGSRRPSCTPTWSFGFRPGARRAAEGSSKQSTP